MAPMQPTRCTHVDRSTNEPCDEWAEDGDRCDAHPRRPARLPAWLDDEG